MNKYARKRQGARKLKEIQKKYGTALNALQSGDKGYAIGVIRSAMIMTDELYYMLTNYKRKNDV